MVNRARMLMCLFFLFSYVVLLLLACIVSARNRMCSGYHLLIGFERIVVKMYINFVSARWCLSETYFPSDILVNFISFVVSLRALLYERFVRLCGVAAALTQFFCVISYECAKA